jgi:hypothetical protein
MFISKKGAFNIMSKVQGEKQNLTSFCEINSSYPVFNRELDFIGQRRSRMGQAGDPIRMFASYPTTENQLVGLCLSGGGYRTTAVTWARDHLASFETFGVSR